MTLYRAAVAAALVRAAWCLLMPETAVLLGRDWYVVHERLDVFAERWVRAIRAQTFFRIASVWANPLQITLAKGGVR